MRVWDLKKGELVCRLTFFLRVTGFVSVATTRDGRDCLATANDRTVRVWDADGDEEVANFPRKT